VHHLDQRWHHVAELLRVGQLLSGLDHRTSHVLAVAAAALARATASSWSLGLAGRLSALQLALRLRAGGWLTALPVALGLLAHWCAHWLRSNAAGTAVSWRANSLALRAVLALAHILRAANIALWLIAVNFAFSAGSLLALDLALWTLAHRVALSRAHWVVALPAALRMALSSSLHKRGLSRHGGESEHGQHGQQKHTGHHFRV